LRLGIFALGIGLSACSGAEIAPGELQGPDATSEASDDGTLPAPPDVSSGAPEDATTGGTPLESGTPTDAAGDGSMVSPSGPDGAVSEAGPVAEGGPIAEGGPDAQPDVEAGPPADGASDAPSEAEAGLVDAGWDAPAEAGGDASGDGGGDGGPGSFASTDSIVKTLLGDSCYTCASDPINAGCLDQGVDCEDIAGTATGGPAAGTSLTQLCLQTLTCILQSGCETVGTATHPGTGLACYCGDVSFDSCELSPGTGACRSIEETGFETTDPPTIVGNYFADTQYGAGMANSIALCMIQSCPTQCFGQ
jgi:hypothetical protein